jgi:hypothetical protein
MDDGRKLLAFTFTSPEIDGRLFVDPAVYDPGPARPGGLLVTLKISLISGALSPNVALRFPTIL